MVGLLVRICIVRVIHTWWELKVAVQHLWFIVVVASHVSHRPRRGLSLDESPVSRIMRRASVPVDFLSVWDGGSFSEQQLKVVVVLIGRGLHQGRLHGNKTSLGYWANLILESRYVVQNTPYTTFNSAYSAGL